MFRFIRIAALSVILFLPLIMGILLWREAETALPQRVLRYERLANEQSFTRLADLCAIAQALEERRAAVGGYPLSQGWSGPDSVWGYSGPDWVHGLAPKFIPELPSSSPAGHHYLYSSNGIDYKLIFLGTGDLEDIRTKYPDLVDPLRPSGAFGFWTTGAYDW